MRAALLVLVTACWGWADDGPAFDGSDAKRTAAWAAGRLRAVEKEKGNDLAYAKLSKAVDDDLAKVVGEKVAWAFPLPSAKVVDGGKAVHVSPLQSPDGSPAAGSASTFHVVDAAAWAPAKGAKEPDKNAYRAGVTVPVTAALGGAKKGELVVVTGTVKAVVRRQIRGASGPIEQGLVFVLDDVAVTPKR